MSSYSSTSASKLAQCHQDLQNLFNEVVKEFDCSVLEGGRGALAQMGYYHSVPQKSKLVYPFSKHNPNEIDIIGVANILQCHPCLASIRNFIHSAELQELMEIDKLDPMEKSLAVDVIPYPHSWKFEDDLLHQVSSSRSYKENEGIVSQEYPRIDMDVLHNIERWAKFAGTVMGIASQMKIPLIWGGDWDGDNRMSDQKFDDWPHFELKQEH